MADERVRMAAAVVRCVQSLAGPLDDAPDLWKEFWDVVNSGGALTDEELEPLGVTAAQVASAITVLENFNKLMKGEAPAVSAYGSSVNLLRRVNAQL